MENKRFLQPFLLEELEIILRKKEQVLQELNGQLRGMRGGSLHVKHRNGRVYYCEYAGGKEIGISKEEDKIYRLARKEYLQKAIRRISEECVILKTMIQKAQKADLKTINSLIDEVFGDIKTSYSNTDLIALASQVFNYSLGETTGFPFEKNTITLGSKGSVVVPCDLKSNVIQLHQFLYDDTEYEPTDTVKSNSEKIISDTGFHQGDGY